MSIEPVSIPVFTHDAIDESSPGSETSTPRPSRIGFAECLLLLSGVLIFVGCFLINHAAHKLQDEWWPVLSLLGLFNLYEVSALALAWLLSKHGKHHASRILCIISLLLLVDLTFVYNELTIMHPTLGLTAAAFAVCAGLVKVWVNAKLLRCRLGTEGWIAVAVGLVAMFGLPVVTRSVSDGLTWPGAWSEMLWWVAALVVGLAMWAYLGSNKTASRVERSALGLVLGIPCVSVFAHLLALHWVYQQDWMFSYYTPTLLAVSGVGLLRSWPGWPMWRWSVAGVLTAVTLGMMESDPWVSPASWVVDVSSWRVLLVAAAVLCSVAWWRCRALTLLFITPLLAAIAGLGATPGRAMCRFKKNWEMVWEWMKKALPNTTLEWGFIAVAGAFVCLAVGGWWAWREGRRGQHKIKEQPV